MKLLVDMNLSPDWVVFLLNAGVESVHWSAIGAATAPDQEIMAYARVNDFIVLTQDLDFGTILAVNHFDKPSVVQILSDDLDPNIIGKLILTAMIQAESDLNSGALLSVDPRRTRLRLLPFPSN